MVERDDTLDGTNPKGPKMGDSEKNHRSFLKYGRGRRLIEKLERDARNVEALNMRMAGLSYAQIAQNLGISKSHAHRIFIAVIDAHQGDLTEEAERVKKLELARLDRLQATWWPRAIGTAKHEPNFRAAGVILGIIDRRARLLGLVPDEFKNPMLTKNVVFTFRMSDDPAEQNRITIDGNAKTIEHNVATPAPVSEAG